jgi:hypothetical protein
MRKIVTQSLRPYGNQVLRRISSPRTKLLAARCECLHLIKINISALWLDESAHACTRSELRGVSCEDWKSASLAEKIKVKVYVNQHESVSHIQIRHAYDFSLCFLYELLMSFLKKFLTCKPQTARDLIQTNHIICVINHLHARYHWMFVNL